MLFGYKTTFVGIDKRIIELLGPFGIAYSVNNMKRFITIFTSGYVNHQMILAVCSFAVIVVIVCYLNISENVHLLMLIISYLCIMAF